MQESLLTDLGLALLGGTLIGIASSLLMLFRGRIAGISGIMGGVFSPTAQDKGWRAVFVLGLLGGGVTILLAAPEAIVAPKQPLWLVIVAGALVGLGVSLGNGCTSGHGVCGVSRLSVRSIAATATYVGVGMIMASVLHGA